MKEVVYSRSVCKVVSMVLHPSVTPTIAVILLLFGPTILFPLSLPAKGILIGVVAIDTLLLPLGAIGILQGTGVITDRSLQDRKQRVIPIATIALCYGLCILFLSKIIFAFLVMRFIIAALCCVMVAGIITLFWKISLHMTSIGGVLGMLFSMCVTGLGNLQYALIVFLILAGILAGVRLQMGCHTPLQIAAGLLLGFFLTTGIVLLF